MVSGWRGMFCAQSLIKQSSPNQGSVQIRGWTDLEIFRSGFGLGFYMEQDLDRTV